MATPVLIPVLEYLNTSYRPDCDYIDGEVKERNLGETPHATVQIIIAAIFVNQMDAWQVRPFTEQRVQISPTRFRVPDVCVIPFGEPLGPIIRRPPLLCIEVLSPEDSLRGMQERIDDYQSIGVEHIWIFDPVRRLGWVATAAGLEPLASGEFTASGTAIRIVLADLNAQLDRLAIGR